MRDSLPADAKILVNSQIRAWHPDYVVPTDGGYWMPLLTHRKSTLLPLVYPGERGVTASDVDTIERLARASQEITAPQSISLLRALGVTHVYIGVRGGPIDEASMMRSPDFRLIYNRGGAAIFELSSDPNQAEVTADSAVAIISGSVKP